MRKRDNYPDSAIMDALDACDYSIKLASQRLGIAQQTLYKWVYCDNKSDNLKKYIQMKLEYDGIRAREKLVEMLDCLNWEDAKFTGNVIQVCKTLLDKAEADLTKTEVQQTNKIDIKADENIRRLLGEIKD